MRNYLIVTGIILLAIGVIGFAFKDAFDIPVWVLLIDLILGVWGMVVLFGKKYK